MIYITAQIAASRVPDTMACDHLRNGRNHPVQDADVSTSTCREDEGTPGAPSWTGQMTYLCSEGATYCTY